MRAMSSVRRLATLLRNAAGLLGFFAITAHAAVDLVMNLDDNPANGWYQSATLLPGTYPLSETQQLWLVEAIIRTIRSQLDTRPIFQEADETIRGHVFCSFLALVLRKALQDRFEAKGAGNREWEYVRTDLTSLPELELAMQGKRYRLRTETGTFNAVFTACGFVLPPALQPRAV